MTTADLRGDPLGELLSDLPGELLEAPSTTPAPQDSPAAGEQSAAGRRRPPERRRPRSAQTTPTSSELPHHDGDDHDGDGDGDDRAVDGGPGGAGGGVQGFHERLGRAVVDAAPDVGIADSEAAVNAAAAASAAGDHAPETAAAALGSAVAEATLPAGTGFSTAFPAQAAQPVSWLRFGALIPVLAGSSGAGASSVAAAAIDALEQGGRNALLIDADDPARSGLAGAAPADGPWVRRVGRHVTIRYSWRGEALVARIETTLATVTPGMMPAPPLWLPQPAPSPLHATVVDLGHGGWRAAADPLYGAGGWLRRGTPSQRGLLVVRATRPSLRQAEQVLARLDPWIERGAATAPVQLVVNGARRWPGGVVGAAGPRLEQLVDDAVFVPHDEGWQIGGVDEQPGPPRAVAALAELLARWGALDHGDRP